MPTSNPTAAPCQVATLPRFDWTRGDSRVLLFRAQRPELFSPAKATRWHRLQPVGSSEARRACCEPSSETTVIPSLLPGPEAPKTAPTRALTPRPDSARGVRAFETTARACCEQSSETTVIPSLLPGPEAPKTAPTRALTPRPDSARGVRAFETTARAGCEQSSETTVIPSLLPGPEAPKSAPTRALTPRPDSALGAGTRATVISPPAFHRDSPLRTALLLAAALPFLCAAQTAPTPPRLTLQEAEGIALRNHPQIQAAQNEINYANQQIVAGRAAYYPTITGDLTATQANHLAQIGAGDLSSSRLYDRVGQGIVVNQLITDSGRTSNLVSSSRLQAQAATQNSQVTRFDVLIEVNRAYFDVLHAQAVIKVAQQTVAARQLLSDQVAELAKNQLRSQLDVSFADVNVSEAKLLLLRAQSAIQQAQAELGRAMGSDQPANYQLADEPLPPGPAATPDELVAQALGNRPELAALRFTRDAAYKFADAEKDLSKPTVSAEAVAGLLPFINATSVPIEYEGIAANLSIPVFNGHLFSARREAATQRAMESDQRLRAEQQQVSRDVRVAWANANDAFQRLDVTAQFVRQAALGVDLAQGRYNLGLSSIIELTQSQLNLTQAEIENLSAKYDYQTQYAALQYSVGLLR